VYTVCSFLTETNKTAAEEVSYCTLIRVSTTSGNTGNLLEFEIPSGSTGNLEFNCSSWKFLYNRSMIDN